MTPGLDAGFSLDRSQIVFIFDEFVAHPPLPVGSSTS